MGNTWVPKEVCYTTWGSSDINMVEAWLESGLLKPNAIEHIMNEKAYKRAMRAHRIFLQSLWQLLMLFLLEFWQKWYQDLLQEISILPALPKMLEKWWHPCSHEEWKRCSTNLSNKDLSKMSTSSFGGPNWKWYLFSSCSLWLRERGYGTCTCTVSATCCQIFFQICPSELCKLGVSVHLRDESVAKWSLWKSSRRRTSF